MAVPWVVFGYTSLKCLSIRSGSWTNGFGASIGKRSARALFSPRKRRVPGRVPRRVSQLRQDVQSIFMESPKKKQASRVMVRAATICAVAGRSPK